MVIGLIVSLDPVGIIQWIGIVIAAIIIAAMTLWSLNVLLKCEYDPYANKPTAPRPPAPKKGR